MFVSWLISIEQNNKIEEEGLVIFAIKFHKRLNSWMFILQIDHKLLLVIFDSKTDYFCTYIIWDNDFNKLFTTVRCHTLYLFIY